ncbi:Phophatidylserine decarboxylase-domain-containing protein [Aspergillus pseudotamarii]|uniref:Phophatidylserine decarboxylase-domain-containing protein n=1 Tax=Aspergillus pseudotamarii TaxID=132259 RepID=A0A5N6T7Y7_ASPPS|nr:Phophatidylserine decarboxylase-domain-containing protein [Aspergillus pseudotamarii]KAE8142494.1 Phophatidylserine decarboxylase-domain-containing protein [Aspergillus pseudotamarii]
MCQPSKTHTPDEYVISITHHNKQQPGYPSPSLHSSQEATSNRAHGWTKKPSRQTTTDDARATWLTNLIKEADQCTNELHPVLKEFQHLIESNQRIYMLFQSMWGQAQEQAPNLNRSHEVQDSQQMLQVLNYIITHAPPYNDNDNLTGCPMVGLFQYAMPTISGYAVFIDPEVNAMLKKVLDVWGQFLSSSESVSVLDTSSSGWFSDGAMRKLVTTANVGGTSYAFDELYIGDRNAPYYGFPSWDAFFTRLFRENIRPVDSPDDDTVIANACESQPFAIARNVKARDNFWIKGQTYSLVDMLGAGFPDAFVGGTIYQGYLDTFSYHRWHAPVSGKVVKTYMLDGTYFSTPRAIDRDTVGVNKGGEIDYQVYISAMATRAVVFIQSEDPDIGLVGFLGVGMVEVSTCEITVKEGEYVQKGDQIGLFHYGGSSHCVIFQRGVNVTGFPEVGRRENVPVRGKLAIVKR